ncbi:MAG: cyanophycin synthetase, partial [Pseudomonadota bacterium]
RALRPLVPGRLITVFGCGGDRDKGKRHDMGLIAGKNSDLVLITSDNPRSEEPLSIMKQIETGVQESGSKIMEKQTGEAHHESGYLLEVDRRKAIRLAISMARENDLVLIAGKGHEDYQIVGQDRRRFDDREEAALAASGGRE